MKEEHSQVCGICEETFATRSKLVKPVQSNMKMIIIDGLSHGNSKSFVILEMLQCLYDYKNGGIKMILIA